MTGEVGRGYLPPLCFPITGKKTPEKQILIHSSPHCYARTFMALYSIQYNVYFNTRKWYNIIFMAKQINYSVPRQNPESEACSGYVLKNSKTVKNTHKKHP